MKKILFGLFLICAFTTCSKDKKTCYECESGAAGSQYTDAGCFTKDEWGTYQPVDAFGTPISKSKCRKK